MLREDNIEEKFLEFIKENTKKISCPEQDTINFICYPNIKLMPLNAMVCADEYKFYSRKNFNKNYRNFEQIEYRLNNPIQLHYATPNKPWNSACEKADIWYSYLIKTPMFETFLQKIFKKPNKKVLFSIQTPFKKRKISLIKEKPFC